MSEKIKEYVPDITESKIAKKVSKSVADVESKIMENSNIYQYGGFKSKSDRDSLKKRLESEKEVIDNSANTGNKSSSDCPENAQY